MYNYGKVVYYKSNSDEGNIMNLNDTDFFTKTRQLQPSTRRVRAAFPLHREFCRCNRCK